MRVISDSIFVNEPQELTVNATISNVSCYGLSDGNVSLSINGGTAPYIQNWNGLITINYLPALIIT